MRLKNKKGFTLLEIIIVVIILAILASVLLPKLLGSVALSRSSEALNILPSLKRGMEECAAFNNNSYDAVKCSASTLADVKTKLGVDITQGMKYFKPPIVAASGASYKITFSGTNGASGDIVYDSAAQTVVGTVDFIRVNQ
jgi:prepilin-type N-terminal cleavage/methylation domain-containing protein